jgi:hypothetical protein
MKRSTGLTIEYADADAVVITDNRGAGVFIHIGFFIILLFGAFQMIFVKEGNIDEKLVAGFLYAFLISCFVSNFYSKRTVKIKNEVVEIYYYLFSQSIFKRVRKMNIQKHFIYWEVVTGDPEDFGRVEIKDSKKSIFLFDASLPTESLSLAKEISAYLGIDLVISEN